MLTEKGSYTVRGRYKNTPYTLSVNLAVRGKSDGALTALVGEYKSITTDGYTAESVEAFDSALSAAKSVLAKSESTQQDIDSAKAALKSAKYSLVPKSQVVNTENEQGSTPEQKPGASSGNRTAIIIAVIAALAVGISVTAIVAVSKRKRRAE